LAKLRGVQIELLEVPTQSQDIALEFLAGLPWKAVDSPRQCARFAISRFRHIVLDRVAGSALAFLAASCETNRRESAIIVACQETE
jgi:hypothetical protein